MKVSTTAVTEDATEQLLKLEHCCYSVSQDTSYQRDNWPRNPSAL